MFDTTLWSYAAPSTEKLLVTVTDWKRFVRFSRERDDMEVFHALEEFYQMSDAIVAKNRGYVFKYLGDAGLSGFRPEDAEIGVGCMQELKQQVDQWFIKKGYDCSLDVNCHFGEVTIGPMRRENRLDVIGETVNICFTLGKNGITLTPQAFRCLSPAARKSFRKHTPPITYFAR